ncbi:hemerythrin domain-containing protein [Streptomyces fenghuangensis]|uniref:Hemerythrin domain-containing protein n=1 Tax=Streptomyces chitinivorans TaxID=1257027 RepID=A0ABW7HWX6_9ACTN|nr:MULTISPECIES: hemerythrin domain-containing protein [Streptomyces]MCG3041675.1 hemerythrin domain-containing protein [Streptomyces sp. ICN903]MDH2407879.1 hemerythrin domain-containing protein [Streptomyces chitinivorans]
MAGRQETTDISGHGGHDESAVALLMRQHGEIRNLFDEVEATEGDARRDAFHRLVRLLAVHETAEEEVVHPYTRRNVDGGEGVVEQRLEEEKKAKQELKDLEDMDPDSPDFMPRLEALRHDVEAHARAEERYEFIHIARNAEPERLRTMAKALKAAEATAPTRPHPGAETAAENLAVGPLAAVADRARDAVRKVTGGR